MRRRAGRHGGSLGAGQDLEESAAIASCRLKVVPAIQQWNVKREYLKRMKKAFDERGIAIALPHLTIYAGQLKDGSAPPFHLLEAKAAKSE